MVFPPGLKNLMMGSRWRIWWCCGLIAASVLGCGRQGSLSGKVTYQGKTVQTGSVVAVGNDGITRTGIILEGQYSFGSLAPGPIKLAVNSPDPTKVHIDKRKGAPPPPKVAKGDWFPLPEKFGAFATSDLKYEVTGGQNTFDLELK